jgi:hypothetical protein
MKTNNTNTLLTDEIDEDNNVLINKISEENIEWSVEHEKIFTEWGDKAMCYKWMHSKANNMYSNLNAWYTIPVIVISTLTGTANFAQERVPKAYQNYFVMVVGAFNIVAGIITTVQQFLKITQLNEAHRVSSISWDKFYRNIKIELAKHPSERMKVFHMIKSCKEEYDRLMETSPSIPENIIKEFDLHFQKLNVYDKIIKPEICDSLIPTDDCRNPWYSDENRQKAESELVKSVQMKENKMKKKEENNYKEVNDFITFFIKINNRDPMESEIFDNLKDKMDLMTIKNIIEQIKVSKNL